MKLKQSMLAKIVYLIGLLYSCSATAEILTFAPDKSIKRVDSSIVKTAWEKVEENKRKSITSFLIGELGLSATGSIEIIGNYNLLKPTKFGNKGDSVFHVTHKDSLNGRLLWSCLVNTNAMKAQIIYRISESDEFGEIREIENKS